jgi:hypothetical protein
VQSAYCKVGCCPGCYKMTTDKKAPVL